VSECAAILFAGTDKSQMRQRHEPCGATAAFTSRGYPCCWIHYQADTAGPRAGKVEFKK